MVSETNVHKTIVRLRPCPGYQSRGGGGWLSSPLTDSKYETDNESQKSGSTVATSHKYPKFSQDFNFEGQMR